jgi:hypothetical protein
MSGDSSEHDTPQPFDSERSATLEPLVAEDLGESAVGLSTNTPGLYAGDTIALQRSIWAANTDECLTPEEREEFGALSSRLQELCGGDASAGLADQACLDEFYALSKRLADFRRGSHSVVSF